MMMMYVLESDGPISRFRWPCWDRNPPSQPTTIACGYLNSLCRYIAHLLNWFSELKNKQTNKQTMYSIVEFGEAFQSDEMWRTLRSRHPNFPLRRTEKKILWTKRRNQQQAKSFWEMKTPSSRTRHLFVLLGRAVFLSHVYYIASIRFFIVDKFSIFCSHADHVKCLCEGLRVDVGV